MFILRVSDGTWIPFDSQGMTNCYDAMIWQPTSSPDGDRIAFTRGPLWIGTVGQPSATQLDGAYGQNPAWSPDGTRIAFDNGYNGIYVVSASGGAPTALATDGRCPAWSPDGEWITYSSQRNGNWDNWVVSASGGEPRSLTEDPASDQHPSRSPDGELIAFDSDRGGNRDVWVVRVTNLALSRVTEDPAWDVQPDWSHDGSQIAFISTRSGYTNLWVASDLRTVGVQQTSWGDVKKSYLVLFRLRGYTDAQREPRGDPSRPAWATQEADRALSFAAPSHPRHVSCRRSGGSGHDSGPDASRCAAAG